MKQHQHCLRRLTGFYGSYNFRYHSFIYRAESFMVIVIKGLGKLASISFAYMNGSRMGADCKKFRLLADIVNDLGLFWMVFGLPIVFGFCMAPNSTIKALTINLLSSFLPYEIRPYIYAISSICWAIVGIAGSCTRTSLTIHQASVFWRFLFTISEIF